MPSRHNHPWLDKFWWRWIAANAIAELVGLGGMAAAGFLAFGHAAGPDGIAQAVLFAGAFVLLGAFEGAVVGIAQGMVLRTRLPELRGWVRATVVGAMFAWAIGMLPSTLMSLMPPSAAAPPEEPALVVVLLLAAALGAVAGPLLAVFQWRCLRRAIRDRAWYWLPANAAAWALGMPVIFLGAQANEFTSSTALIIGLVALSLLLAGGVVGAVHGRVLLWLLAGEQRP